MADHKFNIVLADDHQVVLDGIKVLLMGLSNIQVVGTANNGDELMALLPTVDTDLVILDVVMPGKSGIELLPELKKVYDGLRVIIFTGNAPEDSYLAAVEAGADGILPKNATREELVTAIETVMGGKPYFTEAVNQLLYTKFLQKDKTEEQAFSEREIEIIQQFADGKSYKEIGESLFISRHTVESHKVRILKKMGVKTVIEMVKYAIKHEMIEL